jgi:hypothetical protein
MKKFWRITIKAIMLVLLGLGMMMGCNDDKKNSDSKQSSPTNVIGTADPSYGYLVNETPYRLKIDIDEEETFTVELPSGMLLGMSLTPNKTHVLHVAVLNSASKVVAEYTNSLYIDEYPLDHQLLNFICSWYVEFTDNHPEYGFANNFGS